MPFDPKHLLAWDHLEQVRKHLEDQMGVPEFYSLLDAGRDDPSKLDEARTWLENAEHQTLNAMGSYRHPLFISMATRLRSRRARVPVTYNKDKGS